MPRRRFSPPGFTPADHDAGWAEAARLYARLAGGGRLLPLPPGGIVPQPGEEIYATMPLEFAQFCGMNVAYTPGSAVAFGSPVFMASTLFANALGNRAARRRAELMAAPQWRFVSLGQTILSNTRIMSWQGKWLQFDHSVIVRVLPDIPNYCLILEYQETYPTRFRGPGVPWLTTALAHLLFPGNWTSWPPLLPLATTAKQIEAAPDAGRSGGNPVG